MMSSSAPAIEALLESSGVKEAKASARRKARDREWRILIIVLILNDLLMAAFAFRIAYWLRFELGVPVFEQEALSSRVYYERVVVVLTPIWLTIFAAQACIIEITCSAARTNTRASFEGRASECSLS
jgi:hypothetical protein